MKKLFFILIGLTSAYLTSAQALSIQEKLGYPKDAKLLIIHADDLGVSHSENQATINAIETGSVSSASIMVPTPWFSEIAAYASSHKGSDFGLHLTLTSEWKYYKWGPLSDQAPRLKNKEGFFFASADSVIDSAPVAEVEKELRKQIEKAKQFGVDVTHFDSHMGTLFESTDYLKLYIQLGREYKVPVMLPGAAKAVVGNYITEKDVIVDEIYGASPGDFKNGMAKYYTDILNSVKAGLSVLILHAAFDDKEMQAITIDHPDWGAAWRQADFDFFTSETCKKIIKDKKIKVITWREVRDKLLR